MAIAGSQRSGILSLSIKDKSGLYGAYMSYLSNGGLFVPTEKAYRLGDDVFMLVSLPGDGEKLPIAGKVVWITPVGAEGGRKAGIGVEFSEKHADVNRKIETLLAGAIESDRPTHTM